MIVQGDPNFREYLEARFAVDSQSLNQKTYLGFMKLLSHLPSPVLLDVGTGTAAMIRRIVGSSAASSMVLYGVDSNRDLLEAGRREITGILAGRGYGIKGGDQITTATKDASTIEIRLVPGDLFDERFQVSLRKIPFNVVTCHAFMDAAPLERTLALFAEILPKGGLFYSTLNYDGRTELLPFFENRRFEENLLAAHERSMNDEAALHENRRAAPGVPDGSLEDPSGCSRTGSRLYDATVKKGFGIAGFGSSDWAVFPWNGSYTDQEEVFLNSLVLTIYEEGLRHPGLDRYTLSAWYAERSRSIEERELTLITHQTDLLAVRI